MRKSGESALTLRFEFDWSLLLDDEHEADPFVHFFVSTKYSRDVVEVDLGESKGRKELSLRFRLGRAAPVGFESLLADCNLNLDFMIMTVNSYDEPVTNPAGSVIISLRDLLAHISDAVKPVTRPVILYMVHDDEKRVKGNVTFRHPATGSLSALDGVELLPRDLARVDLGFSGDRNAKLQNICSRYIEVTEVLYRHVDPTIESVANINSAIWVGRVSLIGVALPPIAYTMDVVEPVITIGFYRNCVDIVMRRMNISEERVLSLDLSSSSRKNEDVITMGRLCGQVLCCYVIHCSYRSDMVYAYDSTRRAFQKLMVEAFGDLSVDGSGRIFFCLEYTHTDRTNGDCEDLGKMLIRLFLALLRYDGKTSDRLVQKIIDFLRCYYPFLVLLGVSSAQINASASDVLDMGAHENTILKPVKKFVDELIRCNPGAKAWVDGMGPKDIECMNRSMNYPDLVLEGTGVLEPVRGREPNQRLRLVLETFMEEDVFYALRRCYYYGDDEKKTFYKTVEKIFTPMPLMHGGSFGSFLVAKKSADRGLTKSVSFGDFIDDKSDVCLMMEPELTREEKIAIFECMKDVHPPATLDAPSLSTPSAKRKACDAASSQLTSRTRVRREPYARQLAKPDALLMTYYLRSGKADSITFSHVAEFLNSIPKGMIVSYDIAQEWVTDEVGGYRITLLADRGVVDSHWKKHEVSLGNK